MLQPRRTAQYLSHKLGDDAHRRVEMGRGEDDALF